MITYFLKNKLCLLATILIIFSQITGFAQEQEQEQEQENNSEEGQNLAAAIQNPIAALISVPFQNNTALRHFPLLLDSLPIHWKN